MYNDFMKRLINQDFILTFEKLSLEEKIGQMFMLGFKGTKLPMKIQKFINEKNIGGVILFSRNINNIRDVVKLNNKIHSLGIISPMIWTDQEGGNIVRFGELAATGISPMGITETGNPENAKIIASIIAKDMNKIGIDGVFAPVLDVNTNSDNPVIGIRAFSDDPISVINYGEKYIEGLNNENIASCGKHFPGHGAASADSHLEIPIIDISENEFENKSILPFLKLINKYDSVMTAHVRYPNISEDIGTFSKNLIMGRLKEQENFEGVVFSDCLEMKAIADNFNSEEIVYKSITAGIDVMIISHTHKLQKEYYDIALKMVKDGKINEERINDSVKRILKLKNKYKINNKIREEISKNSLRQNIEKEKELALKSVKVFKNKDNTLPLSAISKNLFIEFVKKNKKPSVLSNKKILRFNNLIKEEFINGEFLSIDLSKSIKEINTEIYQNLQDSSIKNTIIFIYSFRGKIRAKLIKVLKELSTLPNNLIIISLENPYEIKRLSFIKTFLCSYGFRNIQIQASLKTLKLYQS